MTSDKPKYGGMTTNERLYVAGLLEQFDHAAKSRNKELMARILQRVEILENDAVAIAESVLADPNKYGF
jgi:hypothetical protein